MIALGIVNWVLDIVEVFQVYIQLVCMVGIDQLLALGALQELMELFYSIAVRELFVESIFIVIVTVVSECGARPIYIVLTALVIVICLRNTWVKLMSDLNVVEVFVLRASSI